MNVVFKIKKFILSLSFLVFSLYSYGQCQFSAIISTATQFNQNVIPQLVCNFPGESNRITNMLAGESYQINAVGAGCITISGPGGGALGSTPQMWGPPPLVFVPPATGNYFIHYSNDCGPTCGTTFTGCINTSFQCLTCVPSPCASITNITGCGTSATANMSGTGFPWDFTSCNGGTSSGTESIWSFTPVNSGVHSIEVTGITNGPIDMYWMDAATGCSGTEGNWNCIDEVSATGTYGSMNWIAGVTYYILFDPETTTASNITFNIDCPPPPVPAVAGDCDVAIPICTNFGFQIDPNGFGATDELCTFCTSNPNTNPGSAGNQGCALAGELNSTWFTINVNAGGVLEFSFGADGGANYYDWVMWQYTPTTCADILAGTQAPFLCNWNGVADSYTGVANTLPPGGDPSNFEDAPTVATGDAFVMVFSNWSSAITSVPLNFFGTADISCSALPVELVNFAGENKRTHNLLTWQTTSEIHNSHFEVEKSKDGATFEKFTTVQGVGTSIEPSSYSAKDNSPFDGVTYYRLKQVDFNGLFKYSEVVAIAHDGNNSLNVLSAFPNPTEGLFNIQLLMPQQDEVEVSINELNGNTIEVLNKVCPKGGSLIELDVSHHAKGMYLVNVLNTRTRESELIKLSIR